MEITSNELCNLISDVSSLATKKTLEHLGFLPNTISYGQACKLQGRVAVDRAIKNGVLKTTKKGGVTAPVKLNRAEFDKWALKNELLNNFTFRTNEK